MLVEVSVFKYPGNNAKTFTYRLDNGVLAVGSLVQVQFGKQRSFGVVRKINARLSRKLKISPITKVLDLPPIPKHILELADWMVRYYVSSAQSVWRMLLPRTLATKSRGNLDTSVSKATPLAKLTKEQSIVLNKMQKSTKPVLVQGITGSGKTEIYLHAIASELKKNHSCILLLPEILLTEHITSRIKQHFPNQIIISHSGLTPAKRWQLWQSISNRSLHEPLVVVGPRSALFAPLHNLGLIVIDEEHESSYKQESSPYYHARDVAGFLHKSVGMKLVLGSATPSIAARFLAEQKKLQLVELTSRYQSQVPEIELVDMRDSEQIISPRLKNAIFQTLEHNQQCLLFLNRRGTATKYSCTHCGYVFVCKRCGAGLHFHSDTMCLHCHICNWQMAVLAICPDCHEASLKLVGTGTKRLESEIKKLFPDAKTIRIDRDNFNSKDLPLVAHQLNTDQVDIIIGTQMIGRGLDLPRLKLVGIINADTELGAADFSSTERAYQLITQAAGRAGRRTEVGKVIIQTYRPQNMLLQSIARHDYKRFYKTELSLRQPFTYPPYGYLLKLTCGFAKPNLAQQKADQLAGQLNKINGLRILGPVSAYPPKRGNKYRMQLIAVSKNRTQLQAIALQLNPAWHAELDPITLI